MCTDFNMLHVSMVVDGDRLHRGNARERERAKRLRAQTTVGLMEVCHIYRRHEDGRPSLMGKHRAEPTCNPA